MAIKKNSGGIKTKGLNKKEIKKSLEILNEKEKALMLIKFLKMLHDSLMKIIVATACAKAKLITQKLGSTWNKFLQKKCTIKSLNSACENKKIKTAASKDTSMMKQFKVRLKMFEIEKNS